MSDSERPFKIISIIVSALLLTSVLLYFALGLGNLVEAEAVMEYCAPAESDSTELLSALETLRKDEAFLKEVAVRSGLTNDSEPEFSHLAKKLSGRIAIKVNSGESSIAIQFADPKSADALRFATAFAAVAREKLDQQREDLKLEIIRLGDDVEDKRKLLEAMRRYDSNYGADPEEWRRDINLRPFVDPDEYERKLRRLTDLKAKPVFSIVAIHSATLTKD